MKVMNAADRLHDTAAAGLHRAGNSARWFVGISRHGVVAAERMANRPQTRTGARYFVSQLAGSMFIGLGVSLFVHARLGVPAYDVMLTAIRDRFGITLGQAGWLFTGFLFFIAALFGQRVRFAGLVYVISNGLAIDVALSIIRDPDPLWLRMLFVLLGTLAIATGVALVIHAGLTGGALELLMRAAEERGIDPYRARSVIEATIVLVGLSLGGDLGYATGFFVLTMSPILKAGRQALHDHRTGRAKRLTT